MIEVYKFDPEAKLPTKANSSDSGWDLYANQSVFISKETTGVIGTGITIQIPEGYVGEIKDRSSMAIKGFRTGGGIIDAGYNGEIKVILHNLNNVTDEFDGCLIEKGTKIAQIVIYKIETVGIHETKFLWNSGRGAKGFGSSGS